MNYPTIRTADILLEVAQERVRQDKKWGEQNHPNGTGAHVLVLYGSDALLDLLTGGELSAIFRSKTNHAAKAGTLTYRDIFLEEVFEAIAESDPQRLRTELLQTAAVAVAWVEKIDRDEAKK